MAIPDLIKNYFGQTSGAAPIVGDNGRRAGTGEIDVDAADLGGPAQGVERVPLRDAGEKQKLDLLRQQRLRDLQFVIGIAMRAHSDRAEAAASRLAFERLGKAGEEAI